MKKRVALIVVCSVLVTAVAGAAALIIVNNVQVNAYNAQDHIVDMNDCITDKTSLEEHFPSFGNILSCRWDTGIWHKSTFPESLFDFIGPTQNWVNGYVVLDTKSVEKLLKGYSWGSDADNLCGHFKEIAGRIKTDKEPAWIQSDDFNISFGGFFGNFYLDPNNNIILFDLEQD